MTNKRPGQDISERLLNFASNIVWICSKFKGAPSTAHIKGQLLRAGTAPGANYEEARSAESRADFIHKLRICTKELRESRYWLRLAVRSDLLPDGPTDRLLREATELIAILTASTKTARDRGS